jgi:hypothetical protein
MFNLILYLKKDHSEKRFGYAIENPTKKKFSKRKRRSLLWMKKIPIPFKNVAVIIAEETGLIYLFNNDKPWEDPWNIGTMIKNRLLRTSKKVYW